MALILHCTQQDAWNAACRAGHYAAPSLHKSGFIHCSTPKQILGIANFLFRGEAGLVLLCIESERLIPEVRYENLEGGDTLFPHVYGPVNLEAVTQVVDFPCKPDGTFVMPPALAAHE